VTEVLAAGAPQILDLLNYIEQVEKLKTKPAFSVPTEFFAAYQHELKGLPELQFNLQIEGDDVWLRLPRLQEIQAFAVTPFRAHADVHVRIRLVRV
jgi:hypothetical protein